MRKFTDEVQELYREANRALDEAWSRSIDDEVVIENAKLHTCKILIERLLENNVERIKQEPQ
jgi:hypothetical protein